MPDEPIRPALTPDEWKSPAEEHGQRFFWFDDNNVVVELRSDAISVNWDGAVYDSGPQQLSAISRHAVAALCLYGQSFGFTREELDAIEDASHWQWVFGTRKCAVFARAVEKIAALLPPE